MILTRALWSEFLFHRSVITSYRLEMDFKMENSRDRKVTDLVYFDASRRSGCDVRDEDPALEAGGVRGDFLFPNEQKGGHLTR